MEQSNRLAWPVLSRYDQEHTRRIALPLGGIGTGTVSLGGRGNLQDWEIVNRPAKGFTPDNTFFAIRTSTESSERYFERWKEHYHPSFTKVGADLRLPTPVFRVSEIIPSNRLTPSEWSSSMTRRCRSMCDLKLSIP